jgi:ubiquinone/menaquinone biosynthesis C-methylase UbiE
MTVRTRASITTIAALYDRISPAVEGAMIDTLKSFARTVPAPRNDPFYGLDRLYGPSLRTLERLTAHGDFRKYVFVLDGGGGLGGVARWLTLTYGCRVLVLDLLPRVLSVASRLTTRARLSARISAVAGSLEAIPVRAATFTQIWSVAALHHVTDRRRAVAELFRVLRPGSTLALHETVRRSESVPMIGGPWRHGTEAEYVAALTDAGFTTIESHDVTDERTDGSAITRSVEESLLRVLSDRAPADAESWRRSDDALAEVAALVASPDYGTVQFFARRPSV